MNCENGSCTIGFSYAEVYCMNCGRKEVYNGLKPLSAPIKCSYCGGPMKDAQIEKIGNDIKRHMENSMKQNKKLFENLSKM